MLTLVTKQLSVELYRYFGVIMATNEERDRERHQKYRFASFVAGVSCT
jgi:hypothetical protein